MGPVSATASLFPETTTTSSGWITAHCDGGARGNPGPAGFGAVIQDANGNVLGELSEFLGIQTNNFAEYSGLLATLDFALTEAQKQSLYDSGYEAAKAFFASSPKPTNVFGATP